MNCQSPFVTKGQAYGCGQCLPCRINRKRIWTHRIMLEAEDHDYSSWITLTYSSDHLPAGQTLVPAHCRNFLKLLRKNMEPKRLRYYLVGEYGDENERPHYHAVLFGYPPCENHGTRHHGARCCKPCELIHKVWARGRISNDVLVPENAAYTCGYVTKKLTQASDPRLMGRHPEFARMSRRPGIGGMFVHDIADRLLSNPAVLHRSDDVPSQLLHGTKSWPLGRYLQRRLRKAVGRDEKTPEAILSKQKEALHKVRSYAFENSLSFKETILATYQGRRTNLVARHRIFSRKKGSL